jgi:prevent-host-death family protein
MDLRIRSGDILNRVSYAGERIIVERNGKPIAAIISIADLKRFEQLEREHSIDAKDKLLDNADVLRALYAEFADEDLQLAGMGLASYVQSLRKEEGVA